MNQFQRIFTIERNKEVQDFLFHCEFSVTEHDNGTIISYPQELEVPKVHDDFWTICDDKIIMPTVTPLELEPLLQILQSNVLTQLRLLQQEIVQAGYFEPEISSTTNQQLQEFEAIIDAHNAN